MLLIHDVDTTNFVSLNHLAMAIGKLDILMLLKIIVMQERGYQIDPTTLYTN